MKAKRKILFIITLILFVTGTLYIPSPFVTIVSGLEGGGTEGNPYLIKSAADLQAIGTGSYGLDDYYKLNNDINMAGVSVIPIGKTSTSTSSASAFTGTLDGDFYNISNLTINSTGRFTGLFGKTQNATIKNLGIVNANVSSTGNDVGVLSGSDVSGSSVEKTYVTGTIEGYAGVGGFFGSTNSNTRITDSYVKVSLIRDGSRGDTSGFSGWNEAASVLITNSYSASIGEVRPLAGWSDGSNVSTSRFVSTFFDITLSPKETLDAKGQNNTSVGRTSEQLTTQSTFAGWDFANTWVIDPDKNGGYPYLQGFEGSGRNLPDPPGSIVVTLTTDGVGSEGALVPKTDASVTIKKGSEEINLQHQGGGVYSAFASGGTWNVFVGDAQIGTAEVTDGKSTTLTQYIEKFIGTLTITGDAIYGQTLTANLTEDNNAGDLSYQWKRGDLNIASATGTTYTLTEEDIGRTIKVECTSTSPAGSIESDSTSQVTKATQTAPGSPTIAITFDGSSSKYTATITPNAADPSGKTYQYRFDSGVDEAGWKNVTTHEISLDNTPITGYIRFAETDTHKASSSSSDTKTTGTEIEKNNNIINTLEGSKIKVNNISFEFDQNDFNNEQEAKTYIDNYLKNHPDLKNLGVTFSTTINRFEQAVAGTAGNVLGTVGTVEFTVEISKDGISRTADKEIAKIEPTTNLTASAVRGVVKESNAYINGATVKLMQGDTIIAATTTNSLGTYAFDNVKAGAYNLVVEHNGKTNTTLLQKGTSTDQVNVEITSKNSKVEIVGTKTPEIMVGGLDTVANSQPELQVTIALTIEQVTENDGNAKEISLVSNQKNKEFFEIIMTKTVEGESSTNLTTSPNVIELIIPYDFSGKTNIQLFRYHDGKVDIFKLSDSEEDGTYKIDTKEGLVYIYTNKFSTYAIGFDEIEVSGDNSITEGSGTNTILPTTTTVGHTANGITSAPETGDSMPISLLCLLMLLSVIGISGAFYYRKQIDS